MHLDFQTIVVPFGAGLEEHLAETKAPAGSLATAEQAVIDRVGSVEVRPGFDDLPTEVFDGAAGTTPTLDPILRVIGHETETIAIDGQTLNTYSDAAASWVEKDRVYEACVVDRITGERGQDVIQSGGDVVYCGGYYAHCWRDHGTNELKIRFVDATTGARLPVVAILGGRVATTAAMRLVAAGKYVHLFYIVAATNNVEAATFDTTDLDKTHVTTVIGADADSTSRLDAYCATSGATIRVFVAWYHESGGVHSVAAAQFDDDLTQIGATLLHTASVISPIAITGTTGGYKFVAWSTAVGAVPEGLCAWAITAAWASAGATVLLDSRVFATLNVVRAIGAISTNTECLVVYELVADSWATATEPELRARWVAYDGTLGEGMSTYRIGMLSKPILWGGEPYVIGYYHERSHIWLTYHEAPGYPNRYAYLLHIRTAAVVPIEE